MLIECGVAELSAVAFGGDKLVAEDGRLQRDVFIVETACEVPGASSIASGIL